MTKQSTALPSPSNPTRYEPNMAVARRLGLTHRQALGLIYFADAALDTFDRLLERGFLGIHGCLVYRTRVGETVFRELTET